MVVMLVVMMMIIQGFWYMESVHQSKSSAITKTLESLSPNFLY